MGHPAGSMDIGTERYFQVPGQDLVWRYVEPGIKALEGQHSTMAKCASSAMTHLGLRRNSNELYGAYGHNLTYDEMVWLANWCFVRGQNLLFPHAFYYSIRGPRSDERPPDVGPNSSWWTNYKFFADGCRRLSWLNTDSRQICSLAILCEAASLPYEYARICYRNQIDFNYLEIRHLWEDAKIDERGIHISGMDYAALIIDSLSYMPEQAIPFLKILAENGRLIIRKDLRFSELSGGAYPVKTGNELTAIVSKLIRPDILLQPVCESIRCRHVEKGKYHYYILFNEDNAEITARIMIPLKGEKQWLDPFSTVAVKTKNDEMVSFKPYEIKILMVSGVN